MIGEYVSPINKTVEAIQSTAFEFLWACDWAYQELLIEKKLLSHLRYRRC
jgi:hypothetical protein